MTEEDYLQEKKKLYINPNILQEFDLKLDIKTLWDVGHIFQQKASI